MDGVSCPNVVKLPHPEAAVCLKKMSLKLLLCLASYIDLFVCFSDVKKPNYGQGTLIAVPLLTKGAESGATWNAVLESSNENVIRIKVTDLV